MSWILGCLFICQLPKSDIEEIRRLIAQPKSGANLEASEKSYQELLKPQLVSELKEFYSEKNADRVKITLASYTARGPHRPMGDFGFGLHVVKRLVIDDKTVEVNEQWSEDPKTGGFFYPDEIRVKMLAFEGDRFVVGSEKLFLFDSFRVAWGKDNESATIFRRTRFTSQDGKISQKQMRVPVSSPYTCTGCHNSPSSRAERFLLKAKRNHEALVQDDYYDLPSEKMHGFREVVEHLEKKKVADAFLEKIKDRLTRRLESLHSPELRKVLVEALTKHGKEKTQWLGDDAVVTEAHESRAGYYLHKQKIPSLDAIETVLPGKYESWQPKLSLP